MTFWRHENVEFLLVFILGGGQKSIKTGAHSLKLYDKSSMQKNTKKYDLGRLPFDPSHHVCGIHEGLSKLRFRQNLKRNPEHALHPFGEGGSKRFAHAAAPFSFSREA